MIKIWAFLLLFIASCSHKNDPKVIYHPEDKSLAGLDISFSQEKNRANVVITRQNDPYSGLSPIGWSSIVPDNFNLSKDSCKKEIQKNLNGFISQKPEHSFNEMFLAIVGDNSVALIDPQISLKRTKLKNIIEFKNKITDSFFDNENKLVYVLVGKELIILNENLKKINSVELDSFANKLFVLKNNIWIKEKNKINIFSRATKKKYYSLDSTNSQVVVGEDKVAIISKTKIEIYSETGEKFFTSKRSFAGGFYSKSLKKFIFNDLKDIFIENGSDFHVVDIIDSYGEINYFEEKDNKILYLFSEKKSVITAIDLETYSLIGKIKDVAEPSEMSETKEFLYIKEKDNNLLYLFKKGKFKSQNDLDLMAKTRIQAGSLNFNGNPIHPVFAGINEDSAMFIANKNDKKIYYYKEGMMAPIGSTSNYGVELNSIFIFKNFLKEVSPGRYQSNLILSKSGNYLTSIYLKDQNAFACFLNKFTSHSKGEENKKEVWLVPLFDENQIFKSNVENKLKFKFNEPQYKKDTEIYAHIYRIPGGERITVKGESEGEVITFNYLTKSQGHYVVLFSSKNELFNQKNPIKLKVFD